MSDEISRYGGWYKHSNPNYEDFEMWNSVCEDAEPDWEYRNSQRAKREEREREARAAARQEQGRREIEARKKRQRGTREGGAGRCTNCSKEGSHKKRAREQGKKTKRGAKEGRERSSRV